jgi:hypothetical protein
MPVPRVREDAPANSAQDPSNELDPPPEAVSPAVIDMEGPKCRPCVVAAKSRSSVCCNSDWVELFSALLKLRPDEEDVRSGPADRDVGFRKFWLRLRELSLIIE